MATTRTNQVVTLAVSGMTCGSCKRRVENALAAVPGVADAGVELAGGSAAITYDPAAAAPETLVDAVRAAGYGALLRGADAPEPAPGASCGCGLVQLS